MSDRYEYARSGREKSLLLVFPEGTFESLPFEVRLAAPWTGHGFGQISQLKTAERWHLHQCGYAILREEPALETVPALAPAEAVAAHPAQAPLQRAA